MSHAQDSSKATDDHKPAEEAELLVDSETEGDAESEALTESLAQDFAQAEAEEEEAQDPLEQAQRECQELREQLLRERADFDNIRKRLRREAEEAGQRAVARFVRPMLLQLDNFTLALEAANPESFQDFAMGVTMIRDGLLNSLGDAGILPVESEGPFDPAHHEVLAEVPSELPKGHIVALQRSGYRMGNQLVRAAQVLVSSGNPPDESAAP